MAAVGPCENSGQCGRCCTRVIAMPVIPRRLQADHVYGRLAELARRRHRKHGRTAAGKALLANLRASSLGERRPSDHEMSTWDKVGLSSLLLLFWKSNTKYKIKTHTS